MQQSTCRPWRKRQRNDSSGGKVALMIPEEFGVAFSAIIAYRRKGLSGGSGMTAF
jgi:hypothetical protein